MPDTPSDEHDARRRAAHATAAAHLAQAAEHITKAQEVLSGLWACGYTVDGYAVANLNRAIMRHLHIAATGEEPPK